MGAIPKQGPSTSPNPLPNRAADMFNLDFTVQGHPPPPSWLDIMKRVYKIARTIRKRAVGIWLKCLLQHSFSFIQFSSNPCQIIGFSPLVRGWRPSLPPLGYLRYTTALFQMSLVACPNFINIKPGFSCASSWKDFWSANIWTSWYLQTQSSVFID